MHVLLIAAVLSNQLWFDTQADADTYVVTPMATLADSCSCQISIAVSHRAAQGQSTSRQQRNVTLPANQPLPLGQMRFSMQKGDWTQITVTLTDGKGLLMAKQLIVPDNS
ncbi:curli assembly chaperone CsgC [Ewingella americana]|uniref:Curli assembly protein CsgC n=1 Tax=Ewingella americana TaxID=41202 RepID=A0A502GQY5_9GAMM|nr:curli assembly chaperone CsgC [Ewingella americana]TPG63333.1 aggregative fimbriae synthesis protein [Ewingella americana]